MSKYIVYTKKDCKCTTPGYFPTEEEAMKCAYCKGCKYILKEVDLEDAILDLMKEAASARSDKPILGFKYT